MASTGLGVVRGRYGTTQVGSAVVLLCRWVVSRKRSQQEVLTQGDTAGTDWHSRGIRTIPKGEAAESIPFSRVTH